MHLKLISILKKYILKDKINILIKLKYLIFFINLSLFINSYTEDNFIPINIYQDNIIQENLDLENNTTNTNTDTNNIKNKKKHINLIIDPANPPLGGRIIGDNFERNLAFNLAQEIKNRLSNNSNLNITLTRQAGEDISPDEAISFANKLDSDLYINLNICPKESSKDLSKIYIYYFSLNPMQDKFLRKFKTIEIIDKNDIYLKYINKTINIADDIYKNLNINSSKLTIEKPISAALNQLHGLNCPAISLEICISESYEIKIVAKDICDAIDKLSINFINGPIHE